MANQLGGVVISRHLTVALAAVTIMLLPPTTAPLQADVREHRRVMQCHDIDWQQGPAQVARLIRCTHRVWKAPGALSFVTAIARCESGLRPQASNGGRYLGIFQHSANAWAGRWSKYIAPLELRAKSAFNAEANIIVSMRMAKGLGGWPSSQWSCASHV